MTDYLVDNSVWARLASHDAHITARLHRIAGSPADLFVTCPPHVLKFCHSARTPAEHSRCRERISLGFPLERAPAESLVLDIQSTLWNAGLVRAAGSLDILIAGYALVHDATVLTADRDVDHIASAAALRHEYIAPSA